MNAQEIYKIRIEEAACKATNKEQIPDNNLIAHETGFVRGSSFILSNLWIPVEEALPPDNELYFVRYKSNDFIFYGTGELDEGGWYVDNSEYEEVTHWMPIQSPKGGEE